MRYIKRKELHNLYRLFRSYFDENDDRQYFGASPIIFILLLLLFGQL